MRTRDKVLSLVLVGAAPRLVGAALVVALLWAGLLWATSSPGPL
ncbi:MAG: hypothetical protein AAGE76_02505 [Pseudomonadota bacterium]